MQNSSSKEIYIRSTDLDIISKKIIGRLEKDAFEDVGREKKAQGRGHKEEKWPAKMTEQPIKS